LAGDERIRKAGAGCWLGQAGCHGGGHAPRDW